MTSSFGWLDTDASQRRQMLELVDLFREEGTVDELGIGAIRDVLSDALVPGTSVLHTRLRYVLFIPWLMQRAAHKASPAEMVSEFHRLEYSLISGLLAGGEQQGVLGNRAGRDLKRLPSEVYWAGMSQWGILSPGQSVQAYFRRRHEQRALAHRTATPDEPLAGSSMQAGIDPHLPQPTEPWLSSTDFNLTPTEEQYLSDRITVATQGSLLAWLVQHPPGNDAAYAWHIDNLGEAPSEVQKWVEYARRFSIAMHGAALTYNLLLARKSQQAELIDTYTARIEEWRTELAESRALEGWDRPAWWAMVLRRNPRIKRPTVAFVDAWLDLLLNGAHPAQSRVAADLITSREVQLKRARARLVNQSALDRWSGASGLVPLTFRWEIASSHLHDLYAARDQHAGSLV